MITFLFAPLIQRAQRVLLTVRCRRPLVLDSSNSQPHPVTLRITHSNGPEAKNFRQTSAKATQVKLNNRA